jgi:hypothetical protein
MSFLLWGLGVAVAVLGAHVALGWIRNAQRQPQFRQRWLPLLLAGLTLGTVLCASMILAMSAEGLPFRLGYRGVAALSLWGASVAAGLLLAALLAFSQGWPAVVAGGAALAAVATGVQAGWIWAAGFRPGVTWNNELLGVAAVTMVMAFVSAIRVAYSTASATGDNRRLWRLSAAALMGLALIGGQEIVKASVNLGIQVGSVYSREVAITVLALLAGVAVPMGLSLMAFDLRLRDRANRRRRRKHKHRTTRPAALQDRQG